MTRLLATLRKPKMCRVVTAICIPALVISAMGAKGGCGSSGGSSSKAQPAPTSSCQTDFECPTPSPWHSPSRAEMFPTPVTDMAPRPGDNIPVNPQYDHNYSDPGAECLLNLNPPGTGLSYTDTSRTRIQVKMSLICAVVPKILVFSLRMLYKDPKTGKLIDRGPTIVINHPAPALIQQMVPIDQDPQAPCYRGVWVVVAFWSGLDYVGAPFPATGGGIVTPPIPQYVTC